MRGLLVLSQHRFQILQKQLVRKYTKTFIGRKKNVVRLGLVNIKVESPPSTLHRPTLEEGEIEMVGETYNGDGGGWWGWWG
jgi:hypothetical protein